MRFRPCSITARCAFGRVAPLLERRLAVAGALELEEAVGLADQRNTVEERPRSLAPGDRGDDGAEDRVATDPDHRRPDVDADLVERLVVRRLDQLVILLAL